MQKQDIITISIADLPQELQRLHKVPQELHLQGNVDLVGYKPRVGIVGARKFTPYGRETTVSIATALAREGVCIVSGLALGIDSIAHKACLDAGGKTIAVLPSGLRNIYPASHFTLAKNIISTGGLLISEYADTFRPQKYSFLERNRIIAALSDILIIPEAAVASGSLNTASYALDLGIPIMAVPGNITSPYSAGTNNLIKSGAHPLTDPSDVLNMLNIKPKDKLDYLPESESELLLLSKIKEGITSTAELVEVSKLPLATVQTTLTLLEIKGVLGVEAGNWRLL